MTISPKVEVQLSAGGRGKVWVDGVELKCLQGIQVEASGGVATSVTLRLMPSEIAISAESAEVIARYREPEPAPDAKAQPTLNPDGPVVKQLMALAVDAVLHHPDIQRLMQAGASAPGAAASAPSAFPRRVLEARGPVDSVGRISFER